MREYLKILYECTFQCIHTNLAVGRSSLFFIMDIGTSLQNSIKPSLFNAILFKVQKIFSTFGQKFPSTLYSISLRKKALTL